jgi:hypothetical protein
MQQFFVQTPSPFTSVLLISRKRQDYIEALVVDTGCQSPTYIEATCRCQTWLGTAIL